MDAQVASRLAGVAVLFSQADGLLFEFLGVRLALIHDDTSFLVDHTHLRCPGYWVNTTWNVRMVIETVLAMLTRVCHLKKMSQRTWPYVLARLSFTLALFNVLVQWDGLQVDNGIVRLSIAQFSL